MTKDGRIINYVMISPNFPPKNYKFAKSLKERGVNVLGLGDAFSYEIEKNLQDNLVEYVQFYPLSDIHQAIHKVQYLKDKYGHLDWLESNNEYWIEEDSTLREWFNIRSGLFHGDINKIKMKSEMKRYFEMAGVKYAKYHLSDNFENTLNFVKEVGYPIFVKPNVGVGAFGTKKITNDDELRDFYSHKDNQQYIFEQFIDGELYSFDGITNSKGEIISKTSHKFLVSGEELVNNDEDDAYFTYKSVPWRINKVGCKIVKAFDVRSRCFHIELFKLNKDHPGLGKKGEFVALEVNMRSPGGYTPELISISLNTSYYDIFADMIVYDKNMQKKSKSTYFAMSASRKDRFNYVHSDEEIKTKYKDFLVESGRYPDSISDEMGNTYYFARFRDYYQAMAFQKYVRKKK